MPLNALEIETRAFQQIDYQPTQSAGFKTLLRRMHNRARNVLFSDAPFLFETSVSLVTQPDVVSAAATTGDRVSVESGDQWVMTRDMSGSTVNFNIWKFDGTWDGRWVELTDSTGATYRRQIREVWVATKNGGSVNRFSLYTPWQNNTDVNLNYRIYTPEYYLPATVSEIKTARLYNDANWILDVKTKFEMERSGLRDYKGRAVAKPEIIYKSDPFELTSPTRAPTVAAALAGTWALPENAGQFDFCYTYVWGNIDPDRLSEADRQIFVPKWESGPSPVSAKITATNGGFPINITSTHIDAELGFNTGDRLGHSGLRKRIYARRYTSDVSGGITNFISSEQRFYEIAELAGDNQVFTWDGDQINRLKPLRASHYYQSVAFYPMPDARYEVDLRVNNSPVELINDTDSTYINEDVVECLVQKLLQLLYEWDKQAQLGILAERRYMKALEVLTKRYAGINYDLISKRPARVLRKGSMPRSRNVTWTGIT